MEVFDDGGPLVDGSAKLRLDDDDNYALPSFSPTSSLSAIDFSVNSIQSNAYAVSIDSHPCDTDIMRYSFLPAVVCLTYNLAVGSSRLVSHPVSVIINIMVFRDTSSF